MRNVARFLLKSFTSIFSIDLSWFISFGFEDYSSVERGVIDGQMMRIYYPTYEFGVETRNS